MRSFLDSRRIALPEDGPTDPPHAHTIHRVGNRKNELTLTLVRPSRRLRQLSTRVRAAGDARLRRAVVSASANTHDVLEAAGIADLFEVRINGTAAA